MTGDRELRKLGMIQEHTIRRQIAYGNLEEVLFLSEREITPSIKFPIIKCIFILKLKETIRTNYLYVYVVLHYRPMIIFN